MPITVLHVSDTHFGELADELNKIDIIRSNVSLLEALGTFWTNSWHFRIAYPTSHSTEAAKALAHFVAGVQRKLDLLVVSGDLATRGLASDLAVAKAYFLPGDPTNSISLPHDLSAVENRLLLVPGNHDRYYKYGHPGNTTFDTFFGDHWTTGLCGLKTTVVERGDERLFFLSADFCLTSASYMSVSKLGQGEINDKIVNRMERRTKFIQRTWPTSAVVWLVHFSTIGNIPTSLEFINGWKLEAAARSAKPLMVMSGHIHEERQKRVGDTLFFGAGSASAMGCASGHTVHVHTIDVRAKSVATRTASMDPERKRFYLI